MMNGILITEMTECKKLVFFKKPRECELIHKRSYHKRKKKVIFYERERKDMKIELPFHEKTLKEQNEFKHEMEKLFLPRLWQAPWFSASEPLTSLCTLYFFYGHHAVWDSVMPSKFALFLSFNIFLIKWKNLSSHTAKT